MSARERPSYSSFAAIPREVRERLSRGEESSRTLAEMLERQPEEVIRKAVKGMMPRNRLARKQLTKLKVYAGPDHPHAAQQPKTMEISA